MSDTWQPIETAPKDGTFVMLYGGTQGYQGMVDLDAADWPRPPIVIAQWIDLEDRGTWQFAFYDSGFYGEWIDPTHWMLIPEPPRALEAKHD